MLLRMLMHAADDSWYGHAHCEAWARTARRCTHMENYLAACTQVENHLAACTQMENYLVACTLIENYSAANDVR